MENTELQVILEQNKRQSERMDNITSQLDKDRTDIDQIRIDMSNITKGQEALLKQMVDFKEEMRQTIKDTLAMEVPKVVKKEIRLLSTNNPRKQVKGRMGIIERIKKLFKK